MHDHKMDSDDEVETPAPKRNVTAKGVILRIVDSDIFEIKDFEAGNLMAVYWASVFYVPEHNPVKVREILPEGRLLLLRTFTPRPELTETMEFPSLTFNLSAARGAHRIDAMDPRTKCETKGRVENGAYLSYSLRSVSGNAGTPPCDTCNCKSLAP